jgi:hypothetical protein
MDQITFNLIVGTLLRSAIMLGAGYLVRAGLLPEGNVQEWAGALVLVLLGLGWGIYQKFAQRTQQNILVATAIKSPVTATLADIQATVDAGFGATPGKGPTS